MSIDDLTNRLLFKECTQYNISLWQCPNFLFLILGILNISAITASYFISNYFTNQPEVTALIAIVISLVILIIGSTIVKGFDKLLEANKMKTEFIRIASHQLRTPLSSLRWAVNILIDEGKTKPTEEQMEYLNIVDENNKRMIKLINDLLDVTKIEMGNLSIQPKPVSLKEIAQKIIEGLQPLARANNVKIELDFVDDLPMVFSDAEKMEMVFSNLIDNAIKYTKGEGNIIVTARRSGSYVQVSVRDDGVGIPKEQQRNIFQKFYRSDNVMRHQTEGSGLGLFIVKAIIDAGKGSIWFDSQENKGTTFYFKVPIAK